MASPSAGRWLVIRSLKAQIQNTSSFILQLFIHWEGKFASEMCQIFCFATIKNWSFAEMLDPWNLESSSWFYSMFNLNITEMQTQNLHHNMCVHAFILHVTKYVSFYHSMNVNFHTACIKNCHISMCTKILWNEIVNKLYLNSQCWNENACVFCHLTYLEEAGGVSRGVRHDLGVFAWQTV